MKMRTLFIALILLASATALLVTLAGCSDDEETTQPEPETPPDLPPQASFIMYFDDFTQRASVDYPGYSLDESSRVNWGQSAARIAFWNLALTVTLAVPSAAFIESFKHEPTEQEDGSWAWEYSVTVGVEHTCRLVGSLDDNQVHWEMYITKEGEFTDYLWYSGSHDMLATSGTWTVNRHPDDTNPFIGIQWNRYPDTETGDLKYTNIIPGDPGIGSYIFYGSNTDPDYDRFYDLYNAGDDNLAEIEWNYTNKDGRVRDEFFYGDTDWHCWDGNLDDDDCPEP